MKWRRLFHKFAGLVYLIVNLEEISHICGDGGGSIGKLFPNL